jgi:hypothetical protein
MPLLFYFPFIVWMGLMEVAQDEMRVPVRVKTRTPTQTLDKITRVRVPLR